MLKKKGKKEREGRQTGGWEGTQAGGREGRQGGGKEGRKTKIKGRTCLDLLSRERETF